MDHYVLGFEISVDYPLLVALADAIDYLFQYVHSFLFPHFPLLLNFPCEIPTITILKHHELKILIFEAFKALDDIDMIKHHHDSGLRLYEPEFDLSDFGVGSEVYFLDVDDFDGELLLGEGVGGEVDGGE